MSVPSTGNPMPLNSFFARQQCIQIYGIVTFVVKSISVMIGVILLTYIAVALSQTNRSSSVLVLVLLASIDLLHRARHVAVDDFDP